MYTKKFLIDLDGVLNVYKKYDKNFIPQMKDGAEEFLKELSKEGELYLFTTRDREMAKKWLVENKIDKYFADVTNEKIPAYLMIDDRAMCFNGDYKKTIEDVKNFETHWKKS